MGSRSSEQPNVLLLTSDQHRADVLGCEGHPDVRTPNLDDLAATGVRFSRAYCQDAVCAPSRNSMMSGCYPRTLGCLENTDHTQVMDEVVSLQRSFQTNGYRTAAFGKRHLSGAIDEGWDVVASHDDGADDSYVDWIEERGHGEAFALDWAAEFGQGAPGSEYREEELPRAVLATRESELPDGYTMEAYTKRRTVEFLEQQADSDSPFFCWSSFYRPHQPYTPLPRFLDRFETSRWGEGTKYGDAIKRPPTLDHPPGALPPLLEEWHRGSNRLWRLDEAREDEQLYRDYVAAYYALVEEIDHHVGHVLDALEEMGLRENTIVIYTADHGDFVGSHGMVEKAAAGHNVFEETLRVPLIVSWPDQLLENAVCNGLAELLDLYPTLLELTGSERPDCTRPLQGRSLADTLERGASIDREYTVSENWSQAAVVTERYTLGAWLDSGERRDRDYRDFGDMLFDRRADPGELNNRIDDPELADVKDELYGALAEWRERVPDDGKRLAADE